MSLFSSSSLSSISKQKESLESGESRIEDSVVAAQVDTPLSSNSMQTQVVDTNNTLTTKLIELPLIKDNHFLETLLIDIQSNPNLFTKNTIGFNQNAFDSLTPSGNDVDIVSSIKSSLQNSFIKYENQIKSTTGNCSTISSLKPFIEDILVAASRLRSEDSLIAFPTETVYGLGGNGLDPLSVNRIYSAKGRPSDNPLILHISSKSMLESMLPKDYQIPDHVNQVIAKFWPGPLTILFPRGPNVPKTVTGGHDTMAIRMPSHPIARLIITLANVPIAAPSANRSGRPSPTISQHVLDDLNGRIDYIISYDHDKENTSIDSTNVGGVESTVLDSTRTPPIILRPGTITASDLKTIPGFENVKVYRASTEDKTSNINNNDNKKDSMLELENKQIELEQLDTPTTPGMKYRHYSPDCEVILIEFNHATLAQVIEFYSENNEKDRSSINNELKELKKRWESKLSNVSVEVIANKVAALYQKSITEYPNSNQIIKNKIGFLSTISTPETEYPPHRANLLIDQLGLSSLSSENDDINHNNNIIINKILETSSNILNSQNQLNVSPTEIENRIEIVHRSLGYVSEFPSEEFDSSLGPNRNLFRALRYLEKHGVLSIVVESVWDVDSGSAFMNRIRKAANPIIFV